VTLALFDLDNTLLAGDSDHLWGCFLVENGAVDRDDYERENDRFYEDYKTGRLDIYEWLRFQLAPLARLEPGRLYALRRRFLDEWIRPIILPRGLELIEKHRESGHTPVIITATNSFITEPITEIIGVEHLLATRPEMRDGRYTGRPDGTPCYREGKISHLDKWLEDRGGTMEGSWFYSDSHNDIALMERVSHPVAVDPDDTLLKHAEKEGWQVISLRG